MSAVISPLEYPEVRAHLARLKAEHKRLMEGHRPAPASGLQQPHRRDTPAPPKPPLTLNIPLTPEILSLLKIAAAQDRNIQINPASLQALSTKLP